MMTLSELEARVRRFFDERREAVVAVYVFGSVAKGTATPSSDIDLGVLLAETPPQTLDGRLLDAEAELEAEVAHPVQIIVLNDAPPDLVHRVLRDGKLLLDRDPSIRIRFEVRARNEFFDTQPF